MVLLLYILRDVIGGFAFNYHNPGWMINIKLDNVEYFTLRYKREETLQLFV